MDLLNLLISGGFHAPMGAEPPPWKEINLSTPPGKIPEYAPDYYLLRYCLYMFIMFTPYSFTPSDRSHG